MSAQASPDDPAATHVEITNGMQVGPARITGLYGTRLDHRDSGHMMFSVEVVYADGSRLGLLNDRRYEAAIMEAEEAAAEWAVKVHDLTEVM